MQLDGASFASVVLTMAPPPTSAAITIRPAVPSLSSHALLTLRADGEGDKAARRLRLRCSAPCGFEPSPFGATANDVYKLRLGSTTDGATLEISSDVT